MTLRYIRLRDYEGSVHTIPNGVVDTVTNRSRGFAYAVIDIGVAYRENVDEVYAVICEVAAGLRADPQLADKIVEDIEIAGVDQWGDSAVVIRCRFKVMPLEQWGVRRAFLYRLKKAFDAPASRSPTRTLPWTRGRTRPGRRPHCRSGWRARRAARGPNAHEKAAPAGAACSGCGVQLWRTGIASGSSA